MVQHLMMMWMTDQIRLWLLLLGGAMLALPGGAAMADVPTDMVAFPSGTTRIGMDRGPAEERPAFTMRVEAFALDRSPVTVTQFAAFVVAQDFRTEAERFGQGAVMHVGTGRWRLQDGATWRRPQGPDGPEAAGDHPVTQVSWNDAVAYCAWVGRRLPTEFEWEYAARYGQGENPRYAFGDQYVREGDFLANIWTGIFPVLNTERDGFLYTSPVGAFGETPQGLTDMAGNVWEWADSWFVPYALRAEAPSAGPGAERVMRGGSFLCDPKVCHGFRVSARSHATPDSSLMHVGFRCAKDMSATDLPRGVEADGE